MQTQQQALEMLAPYTILKKHDDGDLTIEADDGCKYVITTDGEIFIEQGCSCEALAQELGVT